MSREKPVTGREAIAEAGGDAVRNAFTAVMEGSAPKGRRAGCSPHRGIMAAKRVPDLIPLCHPIAIAKAQVEFEPDADTHSIRITAISGHQRPDRREWRHSPPLSVRRSRSTT